MSTKDNKVHNDCDCGGGYGVTQVAVCPGIHTGSLYDFTGFEEVRIFHPASTGTTYEEKSYVWYKGYFYQCIETHTATEWEADKWKKTNLLDLIDTVSSESVGKLMKIIGNVDVYDPEAEYGFGSFILDEDGYLNICVIYEPTPGEFKPEEWTRVSVLTLLTDLANAVDRLMKEKQDKIDEGLMTESKVIVEAINEIWNVAVRKKTRVFANYQEMCEFLNKEDERTPTDLAVPDDIMMLDVNQYDAWVSETFDGFMHYEYGSDAAVEAALETHTLRIGYWMLSKLETKVRLALASATNDGLMSKADYVKLRDIPADTADQLSGLTQSIENEKDRATEAESGLTQAITAEEDRATKAESGLTLAITDETTRATKAESGLTDDIKAEADRATEAESGLTIAIKAEEDRATEAESGLTTLISQEETRATKAEGDLGALIDQEKSRAEAKEAELTSAISDEASTARDEEGKLSTAISEEETRATEAEGNLRDAIEAEANRATGKEDELAGDINEEKRRATGVEEQLGKAIMDLIGEVDAQGGQIDQLSSITQTQSSKIDALSDTTQDHADKISGLTETVSDHTRILGQHANDIAKNTSDITEQAGALTALAQKVTDVESGLTTEADRAKAKEDELEAKITGNTEDISQIDERLKPVESLIDVHNVDIDGLKNLTSAHTEDIRNLKERAGVLEDTVKGHSDTIEALAGVVDSLNTTVGEHTDQITGLTAITGQHTSAITQNILDIKTVSSTTIQQGEILLRHDTGITKNASDITALTTSLNNTKADLTALATIVGEAPDYQTTETYMAGNLVKKDGVLYECLEDGTTGEWDATKWRESDIIDQIDRLIGRIDSAVSELVEDLETGVVVPALADNLSNDDVKINETFDGGDDTSEENESDNFNFRTTAGNMTVSSGASQVNGLKGRTIVWNQLIKFNSLSVTKSGVTITITEDGKFSATGTCTGSFNQDFNRINILANHKYLLIDRNTEFPLSDVETPSWQIYSTDVQLFNNSYGLSITEISNHNYVINTALSSIDASFRRRFQQGVTYNISTYLHLFDLTKMFGSDAAICSALGVANLDTNANKAKAIENFKRLFPKDYYAYDAGSLKSFNPTTFTASGYNWFNPQDYLNGYGITNGVVTADATKKLAYCKIVKSTVGVGFNNGFTIHTENEVVSKTGFMKSIPVAGASVSNVASASGKSIPFAANTDSEGYLLMECTNTADICVHPKWSQDVADHFEAWNPSVAHIDVSEIVDGNGNKVFPYGLLSAGEIHDEIKDGKAIKRIRVVDMGELSWTKRTEGSYFYVNLNDRKINVADVGLLTSNYPHFGFISDGYAIVGKQDKSMWHYYQGGGYAGNTIYIVDSAYTDATSFKTAMNGVLLYYELATPIEYPLPASWQPQYICNDYGFERFETEEEPQVMPFSASFAYSRDLKGELRNHLDRHSDEWIGRNEFENAMANKAGTSGVYPNLVAGNLVDAKGTGSEHTFIRRTSCGNDSIADDGTALVKKVLGNTIVWNQLANANTNSGSLNGITYTNNGDGSITCVGTATQEFHRDMQSGINTIAGHKYLLRGCPKGGSNSTYFLDSNQGREIGGSIIITSNGSAIYTQINIFPAAGSVNLVFKSQLFDLTQMFGAGNEPTTVEEFEAMFPLDYYPYNEGQLLSLKADGIVTDGFNQWDEEWENGGISDTTGLNYNDNLRFRSKNYIPVFPNTEYYFRSLYQGAIPLSGVYLRFYDINKNFISSWNNNLICQNRTVVTPIDCFYIRFTTVQNQSVYGGGLNINLSWSGYRNGEYEPYWKNTMALPIASKFTPADWLPLHAYSVKELVVYNGKMYKCTTAVSAEEDTFDTSKWTLIRAAGVGEMLSAGTARDEMTDEGMVIRVGAVDLGSLDWAYDQTNRILYSSSIANKASGTSLPICVKYIGVKGTISGDKIITIWSNSNIWCKDSAYTDAATFKTAMQGVILYYELAEPITITFSDAEKLNLSYKVADFGTEEISPLGVDEQGVPQSAPFLGVIKYSDDFTRKLVNLDKNFTSIESAKSVLSAMVSAGVIASYTLTWDSATNKYTCVVTRSNGVEERVAVLENTTAALTAQVSSEITRAKGVERVLAEQIDNIGNDVTSLSGQTEALGGVVAAIATGYTRDVQIAGETIKDPETGAANITPENLKGDFKGLNVGGSEYTKAIESGDNIIVIDKGTITTTGGDKDISSEETGSTAQLTYIKGGATVTGEYTPASITNEYNPGEGSSYNFAVTVTDPDKFTGFILGSGSTLVGTGKTYAQVSGYTGETNGFIFSGTPTTGKTETFTITAPAFQSVVFPTITSFNSTGWNLLSGTQARVIKGQRYMIVVTTAGTAPTATIAGVSQVIDTNYNCTRGHVVPYSFVASDTGVASFTNTKIVALIWSGKYCDRTTNTGYTVSTIAIPAEYQTLMAVGDVSDELRPGSHTKRISTTATDYSGLTATSGYQRIVTSSNIYYAGESVVTPLSQDWSFIANDMGEIFFLYSGDTAVPVEFETVFGVNLVDKLTRDVLTVSEQELTESQKGQVHENLGLQHSVFTVTYDDGTTGAVDLVGYVM